MLFNIQYRLRGQSLIEILVAISVGIILIGGSVLLISVALRSYEAIRQRITVNSLLRQQSEVLIFLAQDNWHNLYDLTRNSNYYATSTNNVWSINSGQETGILNNVPYRRYFKVYDVNRDGSGNISTSGTLDPNTLKLIAFIEYGTNYISSSSLTFYLTRSANNKVMQQTDWSGGSGQTGPLPNPGTKFDTSTNINYASTSGQISLATTTQTGELTSSILDTGVSGGAGFNSFLWIGNGNVKLQFACASEASGPWTYYGCISNTPLDCSSSSNWTTSLSSVAYATAATSYPFLTNGTGNPQNERYIRYKVYLATSSPPTINDIIINWSP